MFARNEIHYESLLGITLEDAMSMFGETPIVYYSEVDTVFLFEGAHVALKGDCMVQLLRDSSALSTDDDWYLPGEEEDTLTDDTWLLRIRLCLMKTEKAVYWEKARVSVRMKTQPQQV